MHSARILAAAAFVMTSMLAAPSSQAQTCDPTNFATSCTGDTLNYCSTVTNEEASADCVTGYWNDAAPAVCGESGCIGADCGTATAPFCIGGEGQRCIGLTGALLAQPAPFTSLCDDGLSCITGVTDNTIGDTCQIRQGESCALAEANKGCVGNTATSCLSFSNVEGTLTDWVGTDCTTFGATCGLNGNSVPVCEALEGVQCFPELAVVCAAGLTCNVSGVCEAGTPVLGQVGDACDAQFPCDTGLTCNAAGMCEVATPCGNVTPEGECNGAVLSFCLNQELVTRDCATQYPDNPASCGLVNAEWGLGCLVDDNATCNYVSGQDQTPVFALCNQGSGSTWREGSFICEAGVGTCIPPAQGQPFVQVCNGIDKLTVACQIDQPRGISCPGTSTCSNGACNGAAAGDLCADGIVNCTSGLTCDATGTCIDPANPPADGGTPVGPSPDAGTPIEPEADAGIDPVTPEADAGIDPVTPEADAGIDPVTPEADAGIDPVTPEADGGIDPVTPEADAGIDPVTPEADAGNDPVTPDADAGIDPVTPEADAGTDPDPDPQPTLDPTQEPATDDPPEDPPAECSHVSTSAQSSGFSGLFAMMLLGLAIRRRRN